MQLNKRMLLKWVVCLVIGGGWLFAQDSNPSQLDPEDIARLRSVSQVAISPNGEHIAMALTVPRQPGHDPDGASWRELHILDRQTGQQRPYVTGHVNVSRLAWTPDGSGIAFLAKRGDDKARSLYVIPLGGGEARRAVAMATGISQFSFSPDGKKVAVMASPAVKKAISSQREKGFTQTVVEEDWQPTRLYIAEPFSEDEPLDFNLPGSLMQVAWSPDGAHLAVSLAPSSLVDARYTSQKIHVVAAKTGKVLKSVNNQGKLGSLGWRPDGKMLAFIGAQDQHDPSAGRLWLFDLATGQLKDPLKDRQTQIRDFAWQSNQHVMLIEEDGVWTRLAKVAPDGSEFKVLVKPGGAILGGLSLSENGQNAAFSAHTPQHPNEVYTMSHGDTGPRRLTHVNPWLATHQLAKQEIIRFKASDGLELEGILIRPLDPTLKKPVPLVLYVHGGPESHHRNGWLTGYSSPGQVAAARGMAVFHLNYRGSTGRGVAFSKLGQADPAGKEFQDLIDGVDHLISMGLVDKKKVAITGGSYGGYATAWGATYFSDRFAAGVMFVGITNTISKVGTTDIPEEEYLVHALKRPWDDWQGFLERSPIYYAGKHRTPLLILHGTDDPRVNVGQSRELYRHLKIRAQAPVRFVTYPGEGHGNQRAASRYDYHLRAMRWLEHYLMGPGGAPPPHPVDYGLEEK